MTISHVLKDTLPPDAPMIFAHLGNVSCSVCAPARMRKGEVEAFATAQLGYVTGGWEAVDKSKLPSFGSATPHPCQLDAGRQHWFLLSGLVAAQFGLPTKK